VTVKSQRSIPTPGAPVRGSRSGAPIMALFDLLGRRWAMGVLWTLCEGGPATFRALQERCETISPSVLNHRLQELHAARFIEKMEAGYSATPLGRRLYEQLVPLGALARLWSDELGAGHGASSGSARPG
jgi:DNA-binding HxlR family transcriptional regulator